MNYGLPSSSSSSSSSFSSFPSSSTSRHQQYSLNDNYLSNWGNNTRGSSTEGLFFEDSEGNLFLESDEETTSTPRTQNSSLQQQEQPLPEEPEYFTVVDKMPRDLTFQKVSDFINRVNNVINFTGFFPTASVKVAFTFLKNALKKSLMTMLSHKTLSLKDLQITLVFIWVNYWLL